MSGSEAAKGVLNSVDDDVEMQSSPVPPSPPPSQPALSNMQPAFSAGGVTRYTPVDSGSQGMGTAQPTKKRRGRPRKYGPDEGSPFPVAVSNTPRPSRTFSSPPLPQQQQHQPLQQPQQPPSPPLLEEQQHQPAPPPLQQEPPPLQRHQPAPASLQQHQPAPPALQAQSQDAGVKKRAKGRPRGSGPSGRQNQLEAFGSLGNGFTTHVINVNTGEDVSSRILSFSNSGPRAICILAASGTLSNVILHKVVTSGDNYDLSSCDFVTYEGRFQILSLSGSFKPSEVGGPQITTGSLSVTFAGPDGRVFGGVVAGRLTAASPIQVIAGSFIADDQSQEKTGYLTEPLYSPAKPHAATGPTGPSSSQSPGTKTESSGGPGSPLNQSTGADNTELGMLTLPLK